MVTLQDIKSEIMVHIDESRKYWLVRTQAGDFYDEFYHGNFIGIGWNQLNTVDFTSVEEQVVSDFIRKYDPEEKMPGLVYSQLHRFTVEMKPGDIVLIPSKSSTYISIGRIEGEMYIEKISEDDVLEGSCPFEKRRKVTWLKTVQKNEIDPYLYRLLYSHHTITDATSDYARIIDRTLHSLFVKGNNAHLILKVETTKDIAALDILNLINYTLDLIPDVNEISETEPISKEDIQLKLNVQSPGPIELIAGSALAVMALGILVVFVVGGRHKFNFTYNKEQIKATQEISTDGILEKILKFMKHKSESKSSQMEKYNALADKLDIRTPEELQKVAELLQKLKSEEN